jgi:glucosamine-6-phosphate deaminase
MNVTIVAEEEFAGRAAGIICAAVLEQPAAVIGLPSGSTPLGLYDELARRVVEGDADFSRVTVFAIDELHGVPADYPATNASYFRERLTTRVRLGAFHLLSSETEEPEADCERFGHLLDEAGGLDLVVLGIGRNGHIAFNEPGSAFASRARRLALTETSRRMYVPYFDSLEEAPAFGLTLGIADLLAARKALLIANGPEKATPVAQALEGPVTEALPASALQRHPALTVLLDRDAASELRAKPG